MTLPMAIVDFIPTILFLVSIIILQRALYDKMSKGCFSLFAGGTIISFMAGFCKATWKLLYAANICNFVPLTKMFMPTQSIGFTLSGIAILCLCFVKQTKEEKLMSFAFIPAIFALEAVAPVEYQGTIIFIILLVLGSFGFFCGLGIYAVKNKFALPAVLFFIAFVLMLCMGYLSSKDSMSPLFNWIDEIVNCLGQGSLLVGTLLMNKKLKK